MIGPVVFSHFQANRTPNVSMAYHDWYFFLPVLKPASEVPLYTLIQPPAGHVYPMIQNGILFKIEWVTQMMLIKTFAELIGAVALVFEVSN